MISNVVVDLCVALVLLGTLPVFVGLYQYVLLAFSFFFTHLSKTEIFLPRVAVLIPAWNEGMVIATTIDRLMRLRYPKDSLRIYVIDDASSDQTPHEVIEKTK